MTKNIQKKATSKVTGEDLGKRMNKDERRCYC